DKLIVKRARKIQLFLSQPFAVASAFTGLPGAYVPVEETIDGFEQILDGKYDDDSLYPEKAFHLVGNIESMKAKAQKLVEEAKKSPAKK
ncbi:MAG TPA: hypothetical protein VLM85_25215, partial [Polyangiaceae bacterium]|nr:hypothetical protein [Polyangiaceae bacterium]